MGTPVVCVIAAKRVVFRIVLAGEARVFHVRCNTYNRIDRTTQREVWVVRCLLDMLSNRIFLGKQASASVLLRIIG